MKLELGGPQTAILAVFLAVVLAFAGLFVVVGLASRFDVSFERVRRSRSGNLDGTCGKLGPSPARLAASLAG